MPIPSDARADWVATMEWWPQPLEQIPRSAFREADRMVEQLIARCDLLGIDEGAAEFGWPRIKVTVKRCRR